MQDLLGGIAKLSQQQEGLERQLAQLDCSIASLAAAIPAAQAVGAHPPAGRSGLECTLRLQALRPQALGGNARVLALEVRLHNCSSVPLAGGWSVLLQHGTGGSCEARQGRGSSIALAVPLGGLAAGAAWQQEFELPFPAAASCLGGAAGQLRVLLCHHSWDGMASSTTLLHAVPLDALHVLQLQSGGGLPSGQALQLQPAAGSPADGGPTAGLLVGMQLQLPAATCSMQRSEASLLEQLLQQGLSSQPQPPAEARQQPLAAPSPALALLQPAAQTQARPGEHGSGGQSSSLGCGRICVEARQLQSATAFERARRVQVTGTAADAATLLACHQGLCSRVLRMQAGAAAAQQQAHTQPSWPRLPGRDGMLLLPAAAGAALPAPSAAAACIDEAALEQALLQLRQLRAAAIQLRGTAAAEGGGERAAMEPQAAEVQRLAAEVRRSLAAVPVLLC